MKRTVRLELKVEVDSEVPVTEVPRLVHYVLSCGYDHAEEVKKDPEATRSQLKDASAIVDMYFDLPSVIINLAEL